MSKNVVFVYFRGISVKKTKQNKTKKKQKTKQVFDITDYIFRRILNNEEGISFLYKT